MAIKLVQKNQAGWNTPASPAMQEETKKGGVRLVRKDGTPLEDTSRKTMEFAGAQRSQAAAAKNDPLAEFNQIDPLAKDTQLQGMRDMYGQKNLNEYQKYMQKVQKGAWTSLPTVQDSEKFHAFTQLDDPKTAYTEARQKQIEKALPTLQHDQQSGYNRTQQIRHAKLEAQNETILKDSTENQIAYLEALADVDALTDAEKKNYKKLRKMLVQEAWKEFKNGNEARSNELDVLNMALSDKARNAAEAGIIGAADALTFGMLGKVTGETKKKAADLTQDQNVKQALQYSPTQWAQATHPKAYGVGSIAGSVAAMTGLGMAERQILNGIKGFESLDKVVKSMIQSSTLFGSDAFLRSAAKQEWDEDFKTAIGNVAFDTASATASGIVSGALGGLTGQALDKWLRANNLWNNAVAVNVARSISSTASAVGRTAAQEGYNALWAWGMDEDYDPKWVDIGTSAMVAGLTTFVLGMINSSAETKASKARLEQLQREYAAKFTALQKGATTEEQAARNVLEMAKIAAETNQLLTNNQFVGQQKLVEAAQNSTTANLETLHGIWAKFSPEAQQAALDAFQAERGGNIAEYFQVSKSAPTVQPMPGLLPETTGTAAPEPTAEATSATAPGMEAEATTPLPGQNAPQMGASLPTGAELAAAAQQQAAAAAQAGNLAAAAAQAEPPAAPEMAAAAPEKPEITMTTPETRAPEQSLQDARALRDEGVTEAQVLQQTGWVPLSGDTYLNPATGEQVNFDGETVTIYNKNTAGAAQKPQTTETMTGGTENAEWAGTEEGIGNSEERPADAHSGGSAGRMETGAERRSAADRIRETVNLQNRVGRLQLDKVSSKELGLQNGTSNQVNTIVPESEYTQTLKDAKKAVEEAGYTFRAVLGRMQTKNGSVDGVFDPRTRTITVRADTMQYSTEQLVQHEMFHALADGDRTIREQAIRTVKERYTEREFEAVVAEYIKQMRGIYDAADEAQHALMEDEVLADAYAGMNRFKAGATYFSEGVREAAEQRGANQIEGRSTESRGPPEQYSMVGYGENGLKTYKSDFSRDMTTDEKREYMYKIITEAWDQKPLNLTILENGKERKITARFDGEANGEKFAGKMAFGNRRGTRTERLITLNLADDIWEIANESKYDNSKDGVKQTQVHDGTERWNYFINAINYVDDAQPGRNGVYDFNLDIMERADGNYVYTFSLKKRRTDAPRTFAAGVSSKNAADVSSSEHSISEMGENVKMRFSMSSPVERTKDLIAVHNKDWSVIRDAALNWGGIPSPSVAIVDAEEGHTEYGDTSVVYPRETIDPQVDKRNKVYGGDAWTPTAKNALVEREVNYEARRAVEQKIAQLAAQVADGIFSRASVIEGRADGVSTMDEAELARQLARDDAVRAAYLADQGKDIEPVLEEKTWDSLGNQALLEYVEKIGAQELAQLYVKLETGERLTNAELETARDTIMDVWTADHEYMLNRKPELREARIERQRGKISDVRVEDFIRNAEMFYEDNGQTRGEVDRYATKDKLRDAVNDADVEVWIRKQLNGVLGEPAIYNGKDRFTESGARRSFKATHDAYTAENIVKAMQRASAKGEGYWGVGAKGIVGVATPEYKSVDAIHADEGRLQSMSEEEYNRLLQELDTRIDAIVGEVKNTSRSYDMDEIAGILMENAGQNAARIQKVFQRQGYNINGDLATEIADMYQQAAKMPAGYFEAKPQRVVPFGEAAAIIAPDNVPAQEVEAVERATGANVILYKAGDDSQRIDILRNMSDIRFSPSEDAEGPQELRLPSIYDEDYVEREPETDNAAEYNQRKKERDAAREDRLLGIKPSGRMTSAQNMAFDADQQKNKQDYAQELLMALEPPKESDPVLEIPKGYMQLGQDWQMQNTRQMQEIYKRYAENTPKDRRLSEAEFWYMKQRTAKGDFNDTRQRMSEEAEALSFQRVLDRDDFEATSALDKMGVKVARSVGQYANVQQLLENDKAFRSVQKEATRVENRLQPTAKEKNFAKQVAAGVYSYADIPSTMDTEKILELADNYAAVRSFGEERITQVRSQIRQKLLNVMGVTFAKANDFKAPKAIVLNYNTAQRNMRGIFGDELGEKVNRLVFAPAIENEAERVRFINRQFDDVREFAGKDGKKAALTKQESMLVQQVIEGRAVEEAVASAEMKNAIQSAAENIKNGRDAGDEAKEWGLSRSERELAQKYARWLETLEALQDEKNVDAVRVDNAVKAYQQKFNEFYDAINDFLVAHGYQPIGFIKGYAPHLQTEDSSGKFNSVLKALGMNPEVSALPTSISGLTGDYKPGKKWNPYFLHRYSDVTNYDIASAYESYVEYMSDVLYHTDDVMTVRAMAEYFRQRYAPEDIRNEIERIQMLQNYSTDEKLEYLKDTGDVGQFDFMDRAGIEDTMQKKLDQLYADAENKTKYGMFVTYLDNYANILAGKQSMADRGPESLLGRNILNVGNKLTRVFGKAQVAGSMSSMLNQTAQLAPIIGEKGIKNVTAAIRDIMSGSLRKADFAQRSDFLTSKGGIDFLVTEPGEAIITTMFAPAEFVDRMMSAIAVRSAYLEAIQKGMDEKAAMRYADDYGRSVMGDRSKGAKPVAFHSKNPIMQMANIFQIEALNTWEHMAKDTLGYDFRQMVKEQGKTKAAAALAGVIVRTLLAAFVLNRLTDELYGGTPAPFDLVGLSANFMASGEGLTTNDWIRQVIDNGWEKISGEQLFGNEERDETREFDWQTAIEDLGYNVMNDTPYVRNIAALLGLGDETLPLPNLLGGVSDIKSAIQNHGFLSGENAEAALGLATEFVPGGRQIRKTAQGISLLARGGRYSGYGKDERMRYPVDSKDPWTAARAILFGPNALQENERFYASGAKALTDKQTQAILQLEETAGLDRFAGYDLVQSIRGIDAEDTWSSTQKAQARRALINRLDLQDEQKFMVYDTLIGAKSEDLAELMDAGLTWDEITKAYDRYQELYAEEDMKAAQKATEFARWLDTDTALTDEKKNAAKEAFKFYSMVPTDAGKYDELAEGLAPDTAAEVLDLLRGLEPEDGKNQVTNVQKYSAILESNLTMADKNTAVRSVIGDSMVEKLDKIGKYGVNYADYAEFKIKFERKFPGESMSQARAEEIITNMSLTAQERAALWQVVTNTKKGDSNPYMVIVGEHVVRLLDWDQE